MNFFPGFRSPKSQKKGLYVTQNILHFPVTAPGTTSVAKLQISNYSLGESPYSVSTYYIVLFNHFLHELHVLHMTLYMSLLHLIQLDFPQRKLLNFLFGVGGRPKSVNERVCWVLDYKVQIASLAFGIFMLFHVQHLHCVSTPRGGVVHDKTSPLICCWVTSILLACIHGKSKYFNLLL